MRQAARLVRPVGVIEEHVEVEWLRVCQIVLPGSALRCHDSFVECVALSGGKRQSDVLLLVELQLGVNLRLLFQLLELLFFLLFERILALFCSGCFRCTARCRFCCFNYLIVLNLDPVSNLHKHLVNTGRLRNFLLACRFTLPQPITIPLTCHLLGAALLQLEHCEAASDAASRSFFAGFWRGGRLVR